MKRSSQWVTAINGLSRSIPILNNSRFTGCSHPGKRWIQSRDMYHSAFLWGLCNEGQIGQSSKALAGAKVQTKPVKIEHRSGFLDIACGGNFTVAVDGNHNLLFWGKQFRGDVITWLPKPVIQTGAPKWVAVAAGEKHCAAIDEEGQVYTWGTEITGTFSRFFGSGGQLGHNERGNVDSPK